MNGKGETMWQSQSPTDIEVAKAVYGVLSFGRTIKRHDGTHSPKIDEPDQERVTGTIGWQDGKAYFLNPDTGRYAWARLSTEDTDPDDSTL